VQHGGETVGRILGRPVFCLIVPGDARGHETGKQGNRPAKPGREEDMQNLCAICSSRIDNEVCKVTTGASATATTLDTVGRYAYITAMAPKTLRIVSWIKAARKDFGDFPAKAKDKAFDVLTIVADGGMPDIAKPLTGLGAGILELVIKERGAAYRVVYALQLDEDIWVVHAFQKKSTSGIATPKHEIDLVRDRIKRLKEMLK
jgi:phage-related protein